MYARPLIDSLDFAGKGREISGEVPVAGLPRLQDILENQQGIFSYRIRGGSDHQGNHFLDVSVTGCCQVRCQRCMEGMDFPVLLDTRLYLRDQESLDAEELLSEIPDGHEDHDSILAEVHLDVLNLLEEEIVLGMPIAPKHEQGACHAAGERNRQLEGRHPFAVLDKLRRN